VSRTPPFWPTLPPNFDEDLWMTREPIDPVYAVLDQLAVEVPTGVR
jgi:hypothetical protein